MMPGTFQFHVRQNLPSRLPDMPGPQHLRHETTPRQLDARPTLDLGPAICADDEASRRHEWLLTNGRGGYACGSVAGILDRRYHAVLAAAVQPPDTRSILVAKLDERLPNFWTSERSERSDRDPEDDPTSNDLTLSSDVWNDDRISGFGHRHLIRCRLFEGAIEHQWLCGKTRISRRLVLPHGHDAVIAEYRIEATDRPVSFAVKAIGGNRLADFLAPGANWSAETLTATNTELDLRLPANPHGGTEIDLSIRVTGGVVTSGGTWYRGYHLDTETRRGYDDVDDHLLLAEVTAELKEGDVLRIEIAAGDSATVDFREQDPFAEEAVRQQTIIERAESSLGQMDVPPLFNTLASAAERFIVERPLPDGTGASIIAGYPWFADWGRDTMISIPGICLATGRADLAREILHTFAQFVDGGMIPNRFPGRGKPPEYNTADAALLFVETAGRTWMASCLEDDSTADAFLRDILPTVDAILDAYRAGTRHGIKIDPADGLLDQGAEGLQLTWMDARIGDEVVTPRRGKTVELNALLHSSYRWRAMFADRFGEDATRFDASADQVRESFDRFWLDDHGYLADVIDGPHGLDGSLRPNQLFATGCAHPPVTGDRAEQVLAACDAALRIPVGLRTLDPADTRYQGVYAGNQSTRDAAYHMGTSWPWLLGPFARTHLRVHQDPKAIRSILSAFVEESSRRILGGISEVHDGDTPHAAGGCLSQAWSVGEILACLRLTLEHERGDNSIAFA
jgi:predicted glycogen debranching enzyme